MKKNQKNKIIIGTSVAAICLLALTVGITVPIVLSNNKNNNNKNNSNNTNAINTSTLLKLVPDKLTYNLNDTAYITPNFNQSNINLNDFKYDWYIKKQSDMQYISLNKHNPYLELSISDLSYNNLYIKCIATDNNNNNNKLDSETIIFVNNPNEHDRVNNYTFNEVKTDILTDIGTTKKEVINNVQRTKCNQYYNTELWSMYHTDYNFIYPGYNRNYESGRNRYFTNASGQTIDGMTLVYNERVPNTNGNTKYNNANWILSEIKNNTFKKHPAADNFYQNNMDSIMSQTTHYELSTNITGPYATGLFAPAGEIITLTFDDDTWEQLKTLNYSVLDVVINENYWDNRNENDSGRISNRYPFLESVFTVNNTNKSISFGSPFGGGISIRLKSRVYQNKDNTLPISAPCINLKFTISGAIPCMYYQDGVTTSENWEYQKKLAKEQKLAPLIQAMGPYYTMNLPFTGLNSIAGVLIEDVMFPAKTFKKWNDFLYLSNYYASKDLNDNLSRLNMEFCDDIWGGAGAWGGGMNFYCPTRWGIDCFFKDPMKIFNAGPSWGVFHEINHNFEQNAALFNKRGHGETNQTTGFNLSVISDAGRLKSELNISNDINANNSDLGWARLNNPYVTIYDLMRKGQVDEYPIYAILLFTFGSKAYSDYIRWDVANDPCSRPGWTGFEEIKTLSEKFKLNLWPAFFDYGKHWNDNWPTTVQAITPEQQKIIDNLNKFPAIDFIGNLYATGMYIYDSVNQKFIYGGDTSSPYEIIAGQPVELNLDKYIVSTNTNFAWDQIKFDPTTKLGGTLKLDNSGRKLIYTPPSNIDKVDEFDLSIVPSNFLNKPTNYVPEYKFKMKFRQVINEPILTAYESFSNQNLRFDQLFQSLIDGSCKEIYHQPMADFQTNLFFDTTKKTGAKIEFNFIAPENGEYIFNAKYDDAIRIYMDNKCIYKSDSWTPNFKKINQITLQKGQMVKFTAYVINVAGQGGIDFEIRHNNKLINAFDNILMPNYLSFVNDEPINIVNNDKYKYKPREIDRKIFTSDLSANINLSDYYNSVIPTSNYQLSSKYGNVNNLNDYGTTYFEHWNNDHAPNQAASSFTVNFNKPEEIKSFFFGHRTNNHYQAKPTHIKITGFQSDNDNVGKILYDGEYGIQYKDRLSPYSILTLNEIVTVKKIHIEMYNEKQDGLILQWFRVSNKPCNKIKGSFGINYENIIYSGKWIYKKNDDLNTSAINSMYALSMNANDSLEFNLSNSMGFNIVGQANNVPTKINVYVNDKLINTNPITISSNNVMYNHCLYSYIVDNAIDMKVKIVHLDNKPLFLNFITKF